MNSWIVAATLSMVSAAPPLLVLVPENTTEEGCFDSERVAAVLALTPGARVLRVPLREREALEAARERLKADLAIPLPSTAPRGGATDAPIELLLARAWPKDGPALPRIGAAAAANLEALRAACRRDAEAAYRTSGVAISSSVRRIVAPPSVARRRPEPLFLEWAAATASARVGGCRNAIPVLRHIVTAMTERESAPVWRRMPVDEGSKPTSIQIQNGMVIAFERGAFAALSGEDGSQRWRIELGPAEPHLIAVRDDLLLAALEQEVIAIDATTGANRWRLPILGPSPEIVAQDDKIFIGGKEVVVSVRAQDGAILWQFDPLVSMSSGPVLVGQRLVIAVDTFATILDSASGKALHRIDAGDEISAPLTATPQGALWAMIGGDEIVRIDIDAGEVTLTVKDLQGTGWPPALLQEDLVVASQRARPPPTITYLSQGAKKGIKKRLLGASAPLLSLPNMEGIVHTEERPFAIVARDMQGNVLWRTREKDRVLGLSASQGRIAYVAGQRAVILDRTSGARLSSFDLGETAAQVVLGEAGDAVLMESGAVYGLPSSSDPRPASWLREARLELGTCAIQTAQLSSALATLAPLLKSGEDIDALALAARAEEQSRPSSAAEKWRRVAMSAPRGDPLQATAAQSLSRLVGVSARIVLESPIQHILFADEERAVVQTKTSVLGLLTRAPEPPLWRITGGNLQNMDGEGGASKSAFIAFGALYRIADGGLIRRLDATATRHAFTFNGEELVHTETGSNTKTGSNTETGSNTKIVRESEDGKPLWIHAFEQKEARLLAATTDLILSVSADSHREEQVLRAQSAASGTPLWTLPIRGPILGCWLSGSTALLRLPGVMVGIHVARGERLFEVKAPERDPWTVHAMESGWLVASGKKLMFLDRDKGRPKAVALLTETIEQITAVEKGPSVMAIASLASGTLVAVDMAKGTLRGRISLGKITELRSAGSVVIALEDTGALLVIDPARSFRPAT